MALQYQCRPSEYLGIEDSLAAFYFDRAIGIFGTRLEAELERAQTTAKTKTQRVLRQTMIMNKWLGAEARKFATPKVG